MFWRKKNKSKEIEEDNRNVLQKLYADRRYSTPVQIDLTKLDHDQIEMIEKFKYFQQYLNVRLGGHWSVQQENSIYGTLGTYDMPDKAISYVVWHGDCEVGKIELKLYNSRQEVGVEANIHAMLGWSNCFEANIVRRFFITIAQAHENVSDPEFENSTPFASAIDRGMTDAVWNAFALSKEAELENWHRPIEIEPIELSFSGDMGRYFKMIERWRERKVNIFELEKERMASFNERLNKK